MLIAPSPGGGEYEQRTPPPKRVPAKIHAEGVWTITIGCGIVSSAPADELDQFDAVAVGQGRHGVQRPGHDLQITLDGHLARIETQFLDEGENGGRFNLAEVAVDLNAQQDRSNEIAGRRRRAGGRVDSPFDGMGTFQGDDGVDVDPLRTFAIELTSTDE